MRTRCVRVFVCTALLGVVGVPASAIDEDTSASGGSAAGERPEAPAPEPGRWTHYGRSAWRLPLGSDLDPGPDGFGAPAWTATEDDLARELFFFGGVGVVSDKGRVFTVGLADSDPVALSFDRETGECLWSAPVPFPVNSSWSTPAIDRHNNTLLIAAGEQLRAHRAADGVLLWSTPLGRPVVNASPAVTTDRGARDRAFIADYGLFIQDAPGRLHCVNVDPFDPVENPYQPGELVWTADLGPGGTGGTPAYLAGRVYVATAAGRVLAFPAGATSAPAPIWTFTNSSGDGFFGGVSVDADAVYAATYDFGVGQLVGELVKLDALTGALRWSVACNRTDSVPIPLGDGRIVLSGGVPPDPFFLDHESVPSIELFLDKGDHAVMLWDTALDTWVDDGDGEIENGEFLSVGGWTHLPAAVRGEGGTLLMAGSMPEDDFGGYSFLAYDTMRILDLDKSPGDPGFVVDEASGLGGTPAIVQRGLYSIGPGALRAFDSDLSPLGRRARPERQGAGGQNGAPLAGDRP